MEEVAQVLVVFRVSLDWKTMNGELEDRGGEAEEEPGVITDQEGLIELVCECVEERGIRGGRDRGVDDRE